MWRITGGPKTGHRTPVTGVSKMGNDGSLDLDHGCEDGETELRNTCRTNRP